MNLKTFGKKIRKRRLELGLTQKQLQKRSKLSQTTICGLETGKATDLTIGTLFKLYAALRLPTDTVSSWVKRMFDW